jgi:hypothetical protein
MTSFLTKPFHKYLFFVFLLNVVQAFATELTGDEALYRMHAGLLDWGFKDHPPMAGVLAALFSFIVPGALGVRLATVLCAVVFQVVLYDLVKPKKWADFALLMLSIPIVQVYGFMATPDAPLLLFAALYLRQWKMFLEDASKRNALLLGLWAAAMMWSKYHGFIIILFTWLPLRRFWFHPRFWLAGLLGIALYSPHLVWQILQDLPTIKFQLTGRNSDRMQTDFILGYAGGQLGLFNPVVFFTVIVWMVRHKVASDFERSCRWLIVALWLFFFYDSFRGRVEAHWTAVLAIPIVYIFFQRIFANGFSKKYKYALASFVVLIFVLRVALVVDFVPALHREFHSGKEKVDLIKSIAGPRSVCFKNSYPMPSLYMFYTGEKAHSINNFDGGKNQFDYWDFADYVDHKPTVVVVDYAKEGFQEVTNGKVSLWYKYFNDLPVMGRLDIRTDHWKHFLKSNTEAVMAATICNYNHYTVSFEDLKYPVHWQVVLNHKKEKEARADAVLEGLPKQLAPGEKARISIRFMVPDLEGKSLAYITARLPEWESTNQSNRLRLLIDCGEECDHN